MCGEPGDNGGGEIRRLVDSAVDKKLDFPGTNSLKRKPRKLIFVLGCFATHLGRTAAAVETKQWGPCRAIGRSRSEGARQWLLVSTIGLLVSPRRAACRASGNDFTCRPGKPRKGDFASKPPRPSSPARCLGEGTPDTKRFGRPSRESRGASVLEAVRARSGGGFSGNHRCCCNEQSLRLHRCWVVTAMAAATSVAGSRVSPHVRSNPKTTVECPLSLRRATRIVSRGLAPFAGKGRASAKATTGDGCSASVERPSRSVRVLVGGLPPVSVAGESPRSSPGFDTTWQGVSKAGRVRDCVVRARVLIVKTDSRGVHRTLRRASFGKRRSELGGRSPP